MKPISSFLFLPDVPDAPEMPVVSEIFKDSAIVTWQPPKSDGGAPIKGYHVEKSKDTSAKWVKVTKELVPECTLPVKELLEGTTYQYRVIAVNEAGPSKPSKPSEPFVAKDPWGTLNLFLA